MGIPPLFWYVGFGWRGVGLCGLIDYGTRNWIDMKYYDTSLADTNTCQGTKRTKGEKRIIYIAITQRKRALHAANDAHIRTVYSMRDDDCRDV